ncbi:hypothetical protein SAMN02910358_02478 [Lachnospiraceae bacterium XBB1006]|nr:hypothetical protein SAMN02910358_02478 [Lachnospiraceae bacterium XBB1006]
MEKSCLRIAICDDERKDRENVQELVENYLEQKNLTAQVRCPC